jgi:Peptidase M15
MSKRLVTASFALALAVLATPAAARPSDADSDGPRYRHRYQDDEYRGRRQQVDRDDDDGERITRRRQHRGQATRQRRRNSGQANARTRRQPSMASRSITRQAHDGAGSSRSCLTGATQALLGRIEANFGRMQLISTCRPGARIAGTGRISKHASGQAIDFNAPNGRKAEVVRWLIANHKSGGTMTYAGMSHIHVDVGYHFVALNSGSGR